MTAQVIYLNQWINCGDDELRKNRLMQDRICEAKARFWCDIRAMMVSDFQARLCYDRFIYANRDRLKLVKNDDQDEE